jgi:ABC-type nitrate/sulfonate/bicarbonate transport system substrate-binding protein
MKKRLFTIIMALGVLSMQGCGNSAQNSTNENDEAGIVEVNKENETDETLVVRISDDNAWVYARESGILDEEFKDDNITFEFSYFANGATRNEALAAGSIDIAALGTQPAISAQANDYGAKIFGKIGSSEKGGVLIGSVEAGITDISQLPGTTVGTTIGGGWQYTLLKIFEHEGINPDDVEIINTSPDTATAIRGGEIAAGIVSGTNGQALINEGSGVLLADGVGYIYDTSWLEATESFTNEHSDILSRLLNVLQRSYEWKEENNDVALQAVVDEFQSDLEALKYTDPYTYYNVSIDQNDIDTFEDVYKFLLEYDLIANEIDIEGSFDFTALKDAGLYNEVVFE